MLKTLIVKSSLIALACSILVAAYAFADAPKQINVPAGDLIAALESIARQGEVELVFQPEQLKGLHTKGARGVLSTQEAVRKLLEGTPLQLRTDESTGAMMISAPPPAAPKTTTQEQSTRSRDVSARTARENGKGEPASKSFWDRLRLAQVDAEKDVTSSTAQDPSASAAADVKGIPEILVYGTRSLNMDIRRSRDDAQPYVVIERETIARSGAVNLENFLRDRLPMNANGMATSQRVTQRGSGSTFNVRGLGTNQTLILIDGHRSASGLATGGFADQTDLNTIPLSAVERIEVLPATASGIYGGGATGGVINIVLRRDYAGVEAKAVYGNTFESDVANRRLELGAGMDLEGGKTNLLFIGAWSDENPLRLQERSSLVDRYFATVRANAPALLLPPNNPPLGSRPNIRSVNGANLVLKAGLVPLNSPITHIPAGYTGPADGSALLANAGRYDLGLANSIQSRGGGEQQIAQAAQVGSFRTTLRREFSSSVEAFLEASASSTKTSGPSVITRGGATSPYRVSATAPNNPFNSDILVTVPLGIGRSTSRLETDSLHRQLLGGVMVALPAGWRGEVDYTWARRRYVLSGGSGGVSGGTTGGEVAGVMNGTLDILRDTQLDPVDLSLYEQILPASMRQNTVFRNATLRLSGPSLDLPGGPLRISSLLEYNEETTGDATQLASGLTFFYPGRDSSVRSVYLEAQLPLVSAQNRRPGIEGLELQLAARADEYRTQGAATANSAVSPIPTTTPRVDNEASSVNPTVAIRYQPLADVTLRASFGTGFVAPDASQLAPVLLGAAQTFNDPKRGGSSTTLPIGAGWQGGNPNLDPEDSKTLSVGAIFTPRILPGLRVSLDYTHLKKTNNIAIYPTGVQGLVNDEDLWSGRIARNPDPATWGTFGVGPIVFLDFSLFNVAKAEVEAFDLQLDYSLTTGLGTFGLSTVATAQTHYKTQSLAGQPTLENIGVRYSAPQKYVGNVELKWQRAEWTAGWVTRYHHSYLTQTSAVAGAATTAALLLQGNGGIVPSQTYNDLYFTWRAEQDISRFLAGTEVQLSLRNIFDKLPPFDAYVFSTFGYYHSPVGDSLGRSYKISLTKRF